MEVEGKLGQLNFPQTRQLRAWVVMVAGVQRRVLRLRCIRAIAVSSKWKRSSLVTRLTCNEEGVIGGNIKCYGRR